MLKPNQYEIWEVQLNPAVGHETQKNRPCVVVSNNIINHRMMTVTIIPLTRTIKNVPFRVKSMVAGIQGEIMVDQIKTVDKSRLVRFVDKLDRDTIKELDAVIIKMFTSLK
ncbi:MAG: type II toxin-antitoxin system PemK/MazF family toxin [Chitinispirillaceae bacterium]|nr:type II toxin-antitoxin system PemK/MazF family toxin [Chitinispirillaceae bacterium]